MTYRPTTGYSSISEANKVESRTTRGTRKIEHDHFIYQSTLPVIIIDTAVRFSFLGTIREIWLQLSETCFKCSKYTSPVVR